MLLRCVVAVCCYRVIFAVCRRCVLFRCVIAVRCRCMLLAVCAVADIFFGYVSCVVVVCDAVVVC